MVKPDIAHDDMGRAALLLNKGAVGLCAFYLALRPISPGLDVSEPENVFLAGVSFLAIFLCSMSFLARRELPRIQLGFWLPVGIFTFFAALAIGKAGTDGTPQLALDLGNLWLSDLFLLMAISITARKKNVLRLYLSCLAAGAVVAGMYTLYQKYYALEYFRSFIKAAWGETLSTGFLVRLNSSRASGPFSYANALAAFSLLCLPVLWKFAILHGKKYIAARLGLLTVLLALLYSGSKAGIACCVLLSFCGMLCFFSIRRCSSIIALAGWLGAGFLFALLLAYGCLFFWGETAALSLFALLWWLLLLARQNYPAQPRAKDGPRSF